MTFPAAVRRWPRTPPLPTAPWRDRSGAVSALKAVVLVGVACPALWQAGVLTFGPPAAQPISDTIHFLGDWAVYLLMASLAITPLRQILAWPRLIVVRRMIGVGAFAYALAHVTAFAVDKNFDLLRVATEIVARTYLAIGAAGLVLLAALAATSTDKMIRRLGGKRWQWLHRAAYLAAAIAVIHFFLQSKADLTRPTLIAGLAGWLLLYRLVFWFAGSAISSRPATVGALTMAVAAGTALAECLYLTFRFGAPFAAIFPMEFDLDPPGPRPAVWVLAAGLVLTVAALVRQQNPLKRLISKQLRRAWPGSTASHAGAN